jgi:hypothetical protein
MATFLIWWVRISIYTHLYPFSHLRKIPAQQQRTCSYHSPEKFLTLSLGLGSLVKEAISTELLSLDRSKIESMFKEIQAIRSKMPSKESARLT